MIVRLLKRLGGVTLALLLIIPSVNAFVMGSQRLVFWLAAQKPNHYAVAYPYLFDAVPWMTFGLLGLIGSLAVITSGQRSWRWLWFPAVTLLYCVLIPLQPSYGWFFHRSHHPMSSLPIQWAQERTRADFERITRELTEKAKSKGEFSCPSDDLKSPSRFMIGGQTLVYEVICVAPTTRTAVRQPTRPATILMRISEDRYEAWFQVTTLTQDVGKDIKWASNYEGQDFIIHRSIIEGIEPT